ncbi:PucR family transcriptional regulator ligand-binding domain-containing protein [Nocardioides sp. YIM 152588]|uniref:PucR family transcriptional regulator n=1 Tax=Nocardioides sp. YIM 152588 TaxID=3158259 RepID=UPI0032E43B30
MGTLSVADVLAMPVLRAAGPVVLAGGDTLDRPVRWVHAAELADIAPLLRAGDLLLSTGIAMPDTATGLEAFAASLSESDAAGLVIELGRRWDSVPQSLVAACERHGLPLVALPREVRFAAVTQSVGERLVDEQLAELRETQRVHETFTELSLGEAGPREILAAVQRLAGATVVVESEQHQVLDYRVGPDDEAGFLSGWAARSRTVAPEGRTGWDPASGWLVTRIGKRERGWGRLVVQSPEPPSQRLVALTERAAAALALHRLHDRQRDGLLRRTHHELLLGLLTDPTSADLLRRCELAGLPTERRRLVGVSLRPRREGGVATPDAAPPETLVDEVIAATVLAADQLRVPALVCEVEHDVRALLSLPTTADADRTVDDLAARVLRRYAVTVGAGRAVDRAATVDRTLREAQHVVESVRPGGPDAEAGGPLVHRLEDVHLRGLLRMLGADERLTLFAARELDPLREHDAAHGTQLLATLRALLTHPGSKSGAAASLHVSRPVLYDRLAKAGRVLGVDLDDPDIRVSLHVALVIDEVSSPTP